MRPVISSSHRLPFLLLFLLSNSSTTATTATGSSSSSSSMIMMFAFDSRDHHPLPCKELTLQAVQEAVSVSNGEKTSYFQALRNITGTRLTMGRYDLSGVRIRATPKRALFIGDSIMGEVCGAYRRITGEAVPLSSGKQRETIADPEQRTHCVGGSGFPPTPDDTRNLVMREVNKTASTDNGYGIIFVGSTAHNMYSSVAIANDDPLSVHRSLVDKHIQGYAALASELGVPVVFVGSLPFDARTVLLHPPKKDWIRFRDFALADLWDAVETGAFRNRQQSNDRVFHYRPSGLDHKCPGIRCDGLHFGSDYADRWMCGRSQALWDHHLAHFLTTQVS